jgi:hypothetical protein
LRAERIPKTKRGLIKEYNVLEHTVKREKYIADYNSSNIKYMKNQPIDNAIPMVYRKY